MYPYDYVLKTGIISFHAWVASNLFKKSQKRVCFLIFFFLISVDQTIWFLHKEDKPAAGAITHLILYLEFLSQSKSWIQPVSFSSQVVVAPIKPHAVYTDIHSAFPSSFLNPLPGYLTEQAQVSSWFCTAIKAIQSELLSTVNAFFLFIYAIYSLNMYLSTGVFNHHRDLFHFHVNDLFFFFSCKEENTLLM